MFQKLAFGLFISSFVNSQLISMKVCTDLNCGTDCVSWTTNANDCAMCDKNKGPCSITNPSSKTNTDTISFYSDEKCSSVIYGMENIPIIMGAGCNVLHSQYVTVGSYDATNLSVLIGSITGGAITVILLCVVCLCIRYNRKRNTKIVKPQLIIRHDIPQQYNSPYYPGSTGGPYQPPTPSAPDF